MKSVCIAPCPLSGSIDIPPSKSHCHRAIIAGALSDGITRIENVVLSQDIQATCRAIQSFGVKINFEPEAITIFGTGKLQPSEGIVDCCESGSTLRFLIPLALISENKVSFTGKGKLIERPLNPYYEIFQHQGIKYETCKERLPLTLEGKLIPGTYQIRGDISSQFVTGLLFTLPLLEGDSEIKLTTALESKGYVDLTIDILKEFSVTVENVNYDRFYIPGNQKYKAADCRIEGDYSQAAFWLSAGALGRGIECRGLNPGSRQGDKAIVDLIRKMSGNIEISGYNLKAESSSLQGTEVDASQIPDLVPVLTVLGALSQGTTVINNAGRLRLKESDRLHAITTELNKIGADITELEDSLIIHGQKQLRGGTVDSWNDHRIVMALAVASTKCSGPLIITNSDCVKKSYPNFFEDFKLLGGIIDECNLG